MKKAIDFSKLSFGSRPGNKPKTQRKKSEPSAVAKSLDTILNTKLVSSQHRKLTKELQDRPDLLAPISELRTLVENAAKEPTAKQLPVVLTAPVREFLLGTTDEDCPVGNQFTVEEIKEGAKKRHVYTDSGESLRDLDMLSQGMASREAVSALFAIYYELNNLTTPSTTGIRVPRVSADERMMDYFGDIFDTLIEQDQEAVDKNKKREVFNPDSFPINRNYYKDLIRPQNETNISPEGQEQLRQAMELISKETQIILTTKRAILEAKRSQT